MKVWIDIESFSACDLRKTGSYRYAEDPTTEVMLIGYAVENEPAAVWDLTSGDPIPKDLSNALADKDTILIAHNAMFDRIVLRECVPEFVPYASADRWCDTMVGAYSVGLPGSLGELSEVLRLPQDKAKDKDGRRLVLKFCKPGPTGVRRTRETDPEDWAKFVNYCRLDVEAMRDTGKRIPGWNVRNGTLWDEWRIDQRINDRGVPIDLESVHKAIEVADELKVHANKKMAKQTQGVVQTAQQRDAILKYIQDTFGYAIPDAKKNTLQKVLDDETAPNEVKEILETRLGASVISVQKYKAMDRMACRDGTVKGTIQFMGASRTGRFAGRGLQMQNFARGMFKTPEQVDAAIAALHADLVPVCYDDPNRVLSSCLRAMIKAPEGKKLVVADLSNIEGRVLAWLAGEKWKIEAFKAYDEGHGPDLYKATYARAFGIKPENVDKHQRQIGKVMELALGYQGGVGAFVTFANLYGVDLDALAHLTRSAVSDREWSAALSSWEWALEKKATLGLTQETYVACEVLKRAWRAAHPNVVSLWAEVEQSTRAAIFNDENQESPRVSVYSKKGTLLIRLRSGRFIVYPAAKLPQEGENCALTFAGVDQKTHKWTRIKTFGGRLCVCAGALVLCRRGWTAIENVTAEDEVWDGEDWVRQQGAVCNGEREVIRVHGVWMTPDHPVLTTEGWIEGGQAQGHNRAPCRIPDGYATDGVTNPRMAGGRAVRQARRTEPVYDLINCGPRHRFVVLGEEGPLIVHNCENIVQGTARDILMAGLINAEAAGFETFMHVHDEIVALAPKDGPLGVDDMARCMTTGIDWACGLPLAAAGFEAERYRKD